jgi:hypothetical protein
MMWTALASLGSLVAGIGIGWAAARAGVGKLQSEVDGLRARLAALDNPIERAARGSQV